MPTEIREVVVRATLKPAPTTAELEARIAQLEKCIQMMGDKIVMQSGDTSVAVSKVGVTISARDITIKASGRLELKASGNVLIKGSKIVQD